MCCGASVGRAATLSDHPPDKVPHPRVSDSWLLAAPGQYRDAMAQRRRGRLLPKILLGFVGILVVAVVAGYWYVRPLLLTGTGYAAHNACALQFVAGRANPETDLPPNPLVPYLRTTIDDSEGSATTSVLGWLASQTAWYSEGFGCTIADRHPEHPQATPITDSNPIAEAPEPSAVPESVESALGQAFADGLGTRAIVVVKDGQLIAERYAPGFTKDTPQLGWSMAKSVTNLLVGRITQSGGITLGANKLRPEWDADQRRDITVEDLLRMRSGLAWDETYDLGTPITKMLYLSGDMGGFAASQPLAHPVGTFQQYSSGSTNIVCDILTKPGQSGPNLPRNELLSLIGTKSAIWEPDASGTPVCSSYLWATPRDWAAIGQFALNDGVIEGQQMLPAGWMQQSVVPTQAATVEDQNYGLGWWTNLKTDGTLTAPSLPADAYWASGHDGQRLYVVPSESLVVARLGFSPGLGDQIGTERLVASLAGALR